MKALNNPPDPVRAVGQCLMIFKPIGNENEADGWNGARIMLGDPTKLINSLKNYGDKIAKVTGAQIAKLRKIMDDPKNRLGEI